jgi:large subunit ribosomal protein L25
MEKTLLLKAEVREHTGSNAVRKVRQQGRVPAIVYGHKEEPVAISLNEHDFVAGLHHGRRLIDVQIGRKKEKMIVKEVQYDYLGRNIIHADLMRVDMSETIKVTVPIELKGIAAGTHESGIIDEHVDRLEVECKVADIPQTLVVWIKDVHVGDAIHAGDIELPENVKLSSPAQTLVVTCHLVAAAMTAEEAEEETPTGPEVIGEVKESEEEASEG